MKVNSVNSQPTVQPLEKLLYRPKEAALVLGVSPSWVYQRVADRTLPCVRLAGRCIRVRREDLAAFAASGQAANAAVSEPAPALATPATREQERRRSSR